MNYDRQEKNSRRSHSGIIPIISNVSCWHPWRYPNTIDFWWYYLIHIF